MESHGLDWPHAAATDALKREIDHHGRDDDYERLQEPQKLVEELDLVWFGLAVGRLDPPLTTITLSQLLQATVPRLMYFSSIVIYLVSWSYAEC